MSDTQEKAWAPPPSPFTIRLPDEIVVGSERYSEITLRAPTIAQVMMATAVTGASMADTSCKLVALVAHMNEEAVKQIPAWFMEKIGQYFDAFTMGPPLFPTTGGNGSPTSQAP